ncbi:MAG: 2-oxoglutarate dehydrogenase E1 component [Bdellovibrio sp.]|nr:MAG: 2-oxoglutarate dehydrogenase E1 component [Bdellovibrio sp.]
MQGIEKLSYLNRSNLEYIESQYQEYLKDPNRVDKEWRRFFEGMEFAQSAAPMSEGDGREARVEELIARYRDYGHLVADLDPLKLRKVSLDLFDLKNFGLSEQDLKMPVAISRRIGLESASLEKVVQKLKATYTGTIALNASGCEEDVRDWLQNEFEQSQFQLSKEEKRNILISLIRTESLEKFIHTRYVGTKRFSIEGGDALLPMLENFVSRSTALGVEEIVIGMAHRGRINVLANFMGKALDIIFADFDGIIKDETGYEGDVKYHMGYSADKNTPHGPCHVSLAFNPSHLEAVNPVALGMTRAKQRRRQDTQERKKVVPILIHGDAAFCGQGVVSETLQLSQLKGYTVGGTIHVILNNQIGFTTNPSDSRSTRYSSDVAKSISAPVILVNGDDVEACVKAMDIALRFRQKFHQDIVIDLICYRRYGHNEGDEPSFTQPKMYSIIKKHPTLMKIYAKKLHEEGIFSEEESSSLYKEKIDNLQKILEETRKSPPELKQLAFEGIWKGFRRGHLEDFEKTVNTQFPLARLRELSKVLTTPPENFNLHPKLKRLLSQRAKMIEENKIDWGLGELLCYASLLEEGTPVRLSGQDSKRGTFSHRHAVYFDVETGEEFTPLKTINSQVEFCIYNSPLSEMGVLGYEYGNASADPYFLTIWEAQFGDFANGAQIIIDQFLASGEEKWARSVGLTLFLPHGYEGQGPEHSSARPERFLQLCAGANMQVCNVTTPANLFHLLRRQIKRDFRKPLVVMTPKSLLRHPMVVSSLEEMCEGQFHEIMMDPLVSDFSKVEVLYLCSGKVFYDIQKVRISEKVPQAEKKAFIRIEQLYPFPKASLTPLLSGAPQLKKVIWLQEEPKNMGAAFYTIPLLRELLDDLGFKKVKVEYLGRPEKASPATGSPKKHKEEQNKIIRTSLNLM